MAIYLWSTLTANQVVTFDPVNDQLVFDNGITSQKNLINWDLQSSFSSFTDSTGKTVTFNGLGIDRISTTNLQFQGSVARFFVGDLTADTVNDSLANSITGSASHDVIFGLGGNDTIAGGDGDDLIYVSGGGNDSVDGGNGLDWYMTSTSSFGITANLMRGKVYYYDNGEVDTVSNIEAVRGSMVDDTLLGNSFSNSFRGRAGNDLIAGMEGVDWALYNESTVTQGIDVDLEDSIVYNDGYGTVDDLFEIENIRGSSFDDYIAGSDNWSDGDNNGNNWLQGDGGNDTLVGRSGDDTLRGGAGDDVLYGEYESVSPINPNALRNVADYTDATSAVTVSLAIAGAQNTGGAGTDTLIQIQGLWGSRFNDTLTGDANNNTLYGDAGNDTLIGGDGDDTFDGRGGDDSMVGGNGSDNAYYGLETAAVTVNLSLAAAQNTVGSGMDTLISIENVIGSAFNDTLTGSTVGNRLIGGLGNDTLDGGLGDDFLQGGDGNDSLQGGSGVDTADYSNAASAVTIKLTAGTQNTGGSGTDTLSSIENVNGSAYNDYLSGSSANNVLNGFSGDDTLYGGSGNDTLDGGNNNYDNFGFAPVENDTVTYATATGGVVVSLEFAGAQAVGGGQGTDTLYNIENLIGSGYDDILRGNYQNNRLDGGAGNDRIHANGYDSAYSGTRIDTLVGGTGTDTLVLGNFGGSFGNGSNVTLNMASTVVQNYSGYNGISGIQISGFENLVGSQWNDNITGTTGNNVINGGSGDDTLNGGSGTDTVSYANEESTAFSFQGVTVSLALAGAQNTLGAGTDTLSGFENLTGSNFNDTLTGNSGRNVIEGGMGDDLIDGGAEQDTASYATASSGVTVSLAIAGAQNTLGAGVDTLVRIERLQGSSFNDTLTSGSAGSTNTLIGSVGADILTGRTGVDYFAYTSSADSVAGLFDVITNFSTAQGDKLDLSLVDANATLSGDQAFSFIGAAAFTAAGQVRYDAGTNMLYAETTGDGSADMQIQLTGVASLLSSDFVL